MRNLKIWLALFLLSNILPSQLIAGNILKIGQYSVAPNTEFTVHLEAENDSSFVAFQVDIPLPEGFKYVDGSAVLNVSRISGHVLSTSVLTGNILRLIGYSVGNVAFIGNSGTLVSFTFKSCALPATYSLTLNQPMLGNSHSNNILTSSTNGQVTVLAPNISFSATEINYGRVPLGTTAERSLQISNTGNSDLIISNLNFSDSQFSTTQVNNFTISANSSRSITLKFTPTAKGTLAKQLQIVSNDSDQPTTTIALNAVAFAVNEIHTGNITGASSSTGKLEFTLNNMEEFTGLQFDLALPQPMTYSSGSVQLFRSQDQTVSVNHLNAQTLRVLVFSSGNKNFTGTGGKVLSLDFLLKGTAGYYSIGINNVIIANASGENILSASFGGQLVITSPDISAPTQLGFGDVSILSNKSLNLRINNYGQEPLTITQLMFPNDYFKSSQTLPVTIQSYCYLDLPVEFAKSTEGASSGTMKIISDDPDENPFSVQLTGNAFMPNYLKIDTVNFVQGDNKIVPVEIENVEQFVAFQLDLNYPLKFTPDLNGIALTGRKQDHVLSAVALSPTSLRLLVYSPGQKTFTGSSGPILNIPFTADSTLTPGSYNLTFSNAFISDTKSENILYASKNGVLNVQRLNHVPVANAGNDRIVNEASVVTLDGSASSDSDNDALTYKWTAPSGITLSSTTAVKPTFTVPKVTKDTTFTFILIVNDGTVDSPVDQVVITIKNVIFTHDIPLIPGWNIISSNVIPSNTNLKDIFQPLIDAGKLKKVMDESGKSIENLGAFGGWKNNIGNFIQTEGYKVNVTDALTLSLEGPSVQLPLNINLSIGWNIISYPCVNAQNALNMVQPLIDAGKLKKVMDETGKSIENLGVFGGWKNNIGNFVAGKGFKVNVTESGILTITSSELREAATLPDVLPSTYFIRAFEGNGTDHMNIHLVNLDASTLQVGDEIGIFDGKVCVGSATIGIDQLVSGSISIPASSNDELEKIVNGFIPGHNVMIKIYSDEETYNLTVEKLWGSDTFEKNGSLFAKVKSKKPTDIPMTEESVQFICHPNPFSEEISIDVQNSMPTELIVEIYNLLGKKIKRLYEGINIGCLYLKWNGTDEKENQVDPGIYLCRINNQSKKIVLIGSK